MNRPSDRLAGLGIALPRPWTLPSGLIIHAEFVRVVGRRLTISGHVPLNDDGTIAGPFGRVGAEVSTAQAKASAERAMLAIFASIVRELNTLDRVADWVRVFGMVNAAADFHDYPSVIDAASRLVYKVFGPDAGRHSRVAVGVGGLPFNVPVEIEAEAELA